MFINNLLKKKVVMETEIKNAVLMFSPHPKAKRMQFSIPYVQKEDWQRIKQIPGAFYNRTQQMWSLPNTEGNLKRVQSYFGERLIIEERSKRATIPKIEASEKVQQELDRNHQTMVLKGFSESTIKTYTHDLKLFFNYFEKYDLKSIGKEQIEGFVFHLISKYKISEQKQNAIINAIKCYYEHCLEMPREYYNITRPKKSTNLPNVLSEEEVIKVLNQPANIKHRAILHTIYAAGLRVGEVIRLRIDDVRSEDGYLFIKDSKGKKDRHSVLSPYLLDILREYYKAYKPSYWLFEGQTGGQYSSRSIQSIYRKAVKETGVNPWSTPHTLRHSFATHLMQRGVNIRYIQSALGHASSKTTEVYTRIIAINNKTLTSPLDSLYNSTKFGNNKH